MQVELLSGMPLSFLDTNGSTGSATLTSSGTYLTTANFTGSGNFEAVVLPSLTNTTGCGSYTNPLIQLAVLVLSLDATVSPFHPLMLAFINSLTLSAFTQLFDHCSNLPTTHCLCVSMCWIPEEVISFTSPCDKL